MEEKITNFGCPLTPGDLSELGVTREWKQSHETSLTGLPNWKPVGTSSAACPGPVWGLGGDQPQGPQGTETGLIPDGAGSLGRVPRLPKDADLLPPSPVPAKISRFPRSCHLIAVAMETAAPRPPPRAGLWQSRGVSELPIQHLGPHRTSVDGGMGPAIAPGTSPGWSPATVWVPKDPPSRPPQGWRSPPQ